MVGLRGWVCKLLGFGLLLVVSFTLLVYSMFVWFVWMFCVALNSVGGYVFVRYLDDSVLLCLFYVGCWLLLRFCGVAFILSVLLFIVVYDFDVWCLLLWFVASGLPRVSCLLVWFVA